MAMQAYVLFDHMCMLCRSHVIVIFTYLHKRQVCVRKHHVKDKDAIHGFNGEGRKREKGNKRDRGEKE
jgi:predicted DCC family thiol-disulfide oxidoreductase YuxK